MKLLFINPPYYYNNHTLPNKAMLPVGPLSVADSLIKQGHQVDFFDLVFNKNWLNTIKSIKPQKYDQILISCHTTRNIKSLQKITNIFRDKYIILGGNLATNLNLKHFHQLKIKVDKLFKGYYPNFTGTPKLYLLSHKTQLQYLKLSGKKYPIVGPGGFGCHWRCKYCLANMRSQATPRSINSILEELHQAKKYHYQHLWCVDNNLFQFPKQLKNFADQTSKLNLTWSGMTRAETITDQKLLNYLKHRGLNEISIGIESVSTKQLKQYRRHNNIVKIKKAFSLLNKYKINSNAFIILGGPDENQKSFWQLYNLLRKIKPTTVSWSFYNPPPHKTLINQKINSDQLGFYNWPLTNSENKNKKIVQQAMIISGTWWKQWSLNKTCPFFQNKNMFGVNFKQGLIYQNKNQRSSQGNIWEIWLEKTN